MTTRTSRFAPAFPILFARASLLALPLIMTACGGGHSSTTSSTDATPSSAPRATAQALPANTVALPMSSTPVARTETQVYSDNFESSTINWFDNWWPNPGVANFSYGLTTAAGTVHGGAQAGKFRVDDPTNAIFIHNPDWVFNLNQRYKITAWIKADAPTTADLMLRGGGDNYFRQYATAHVSVTTAWQQVTLEGIPGEASTAFILVPAKGVTVYLDDVTVYQVTQNELKPFNSTSAIPDTLFGMHMNQMGTVSNWAKTWPKIGQKVLRLHDTGTHWVNVETSRGTYDFGRLDMFVSLVKGDGPKGTAENFPQFGISPPASPADVLYELGMTPAWASSKPTAGGSYGAGTTYPPANMQDWSDYVTRMGTRYKGRIKYWEIWNEWDIPAINYDGDVASMVTMTQIAHDVLKKIDPNFVIVAPSVTVGGLPVLEAFFKAGGAKYVDVIAYHAGGGQADPVSTYAPAANVRAVMAANNVNLPLWDTEAGAGCDPNVTPNCNLNSATLAADLTPTALGWPLRHLVTLWDQGVSNFNYYFYEGAGNGASALVYGLYEHGTQALCGTGWDSTFPDLNPNCQTPLGKAYTRAVSFLKGAVLSDAYQTNGVNGRIFIFKFLVGGQLQVVLWSTGADETVRLPKDLVTSTSWSSLKYTNTVTGDKVAIPSGYFNVNGSNLLYRYVTAGTAPLVLTAN